MPVDRVDPTDLRSQREAEAQAERDRRDIRTRELDDIRWLMSDKRGRRVMHKLLELGHIYHSSFDGSGSSTFFREGERNLALRFFVEAQEAAPERYAEMLKEARDDHRNAGDRQR